MEIIEFRQISKNDICDMNKYGHWSRHYEYPLINNFLQKNLQLGSKIHNTSWGWEPPNHTEFKNDLEKFFEKSNVINSDLNSSTYDNTIVWNILEQPKDEWINNFDAVINVSTLEEINGNHVECFKNLWSQVKIGGYLILTFDLPGLQLNEFEIFLNKKFLYSENPITSSGLTVGLLILKKINP
jgi:hypothetical protein